MRFVVLDIETTGLSPDVDAVLQLAMQEVDPSTLEPIGEMFATPVQAGVHVMARLKANKYVLDMHTETGLINKLADAPRRSHVQRDACAFLGESKDTIHVVGDSVHFDLAFLRVHMPKLFKRFSHRIVDTTSMWLAAKSAGVEEFAGVNYNAHDAAADVRFSIEKLKFYRGLFK